MPMSTSQDSLTTFGYQRALRNRVSDIDLSKNRVYDIHRYTPTFVHDSLMLPGSLSNVVGQGSSEDIVHRMTPALLLGFQSLVHGETYQPCLLPSVDSSHYVQGMVIFGQGKRGRGCIHRHYRPHARRVKVEVQIDVAVGNFELDTTTEILQDAVLGMRHISQGHNIIQRKTIWAHAWIWARTDRNEGQACTTPLTWNIEDYLKGNFGTEGTLNIDTGKEDDGTEVMLDVKAETSDDYCDGESEKQTYRLDIACPAGGVGLLDYERSNTFTGW